VSGYSIVEMLQETALVALVRHDKPRRLQFTNPVQRTIICTLNFVTPILAVRMNMQRYALFNRLHQQLQRDVLTKRSTANSSGLCWYWNPRSTSTRSPKWSCCTRSIPTPILEVGHQSTQHQLVAWHVLCSHDSLSFALADC
jgi:hypothetical protein